MNNNINAQTTPISPLTVAHTKSRLERGNSKTSRPRKQSGDISGSFGLNQDLDTTPGNFSLKQSRNRGQHP
jgi:hypothetical protein